MKKALWLFTALMFAPGVTLAAQQCTPNDTSARILASPDPDDIHPEWSDGSTIGLSWTFEGRPAGSSGEYLKGRLISPKGGVSSYQVYIIADEWDCE